MGRILCCILALMMFCGGRAEEVLPPEKELRSAHIRAVGDIMVSAKQLEYALLDGSYDFTPQFAWIEDSLACADYTIGNLETTIGQYEDRDYSGYPQFNSPESVLDALDGAGFDFLSLANNHMLDRWFDGMKRTVDNVEAYGFDHVGAYRTQGERNSAKIVEINGIKVGFVAYTHTTNSMEKTSSKDAKKFGVPFLASADIEGDIARLRANGAEFVIAIAHWGAEYILAPDGQQKKYAQRLVEAGADVILGGHSHTVQPMGYATFGNNTSFIIFSMGNFVATQTKKHTNAGLILDFTIQEQQDGTFKCENVGYVPTYIWKQEHTMQVISSAKYYDEPPAGMDEETAEAMRAAYDEIVERIGDEFAILEE